MIGDPARLAETEALRALRAGRRAGLAHRAASYAFRAAAGDLGGRLGERPPEDWAAALEAALQAALGDAVWVNATDLLPQSAPLDQPLLLLWPASRR